MQGRRVLEAVATADESLPVAAVLAHVRCSYNRTG
jgi:hypothetical protein